MVNHPKFEFDTITLPENGELEALNNLGKKGGLLPLWMETSVFFNVFS